jgi:ABC-type multidrug transport system fused ATPase/permease subunit
MILADYSLGDVLLSMLVFMFWIIWIYLLIIVFIDIFRSHDLSGWAKALWVIFVVILPYLGVLVYLIARGDEMSKHAMDSAAAQDQAQRDYIQSVSGGDTADQLEKLSALHANGTLSDEEYAAAKAKAIG